MRPFLNSPNILEKAMPYLSLENLAGHGGRHKCVVAALKKMNPSPSLPVTSDGVE
jgi:hypothetical protein